MRCAFAKGGRSETYVDMLKKEQSLTAAAEYVRVILFESILGTVIVVRTIFAVHPFTTE